MARKNSIADQLAGKGKPKGGKPDEVEEDDIDLDVEDEQDEDDEDDEQDEDDEDDEKLKPSGVKALRAERKARRAAQRELAELKAKKPKSKKDDEDDEDDGPSAREIAADNKLKTAGLKAALVDAGVSARNVKLLVAQVNLRDVELDDDDDVEDADEFVDELKEQYPDLFGKGKSSDDEDEPRRRRVPGGRDGGQRGRVETKPKSSADRLVAGLLGKG